MQIQLHIQQIQMQIQMKMQIQIKIQMKIQILPVQSRLTGMSIIQFHSLDTSTDQAHWTLSTGQHVCDNHSDNNTMCVPGM